MKTNQVIALRISDIEKKIKNTVDRLSQDPADRVALKIQLRDLHEALRVNEMFLGNTAKVAENSGKR